MNMFWHELRAYRKGTIIWAVSIILLLVTSMAKFTTLTSGGVDAKKLLAGFPPAVQAIFGLNGLDITTVVGYFGILYLYVTIILSIHAGLLGADIVAKEEQEKTAEFLYVKPRSRHYILTTKLLVALTLVVLMNVVTFATSCALASRYVMLQTVIHELLLFSGAYLVLQLLFMAIGMMVAASAWLKYAGKIVAVLVVAMYFVSVAVSVQPSLSGVGKLSPLVQFEASKTIATGSWPIGWAVGDLMLTAGCIVGAYLFYRRRDLKT